MFHRFHSETYPSLGAGSLTAAQFEQMLNFTGIENILTPEEWLSRLSRNTLRPSDLCLTFDDGLKCQIEVCLPVLEKYRLKAFWFVYNAPLDGKPVKHEIFSLFAAQYFPDIDRFYELFFSRAQKFLTRFDSENFEEYRKRMMAQFPFYSLNDLKYRFIRNETLPKPVFEDVIEGMMLEKGAKSPEIAKRLWLSEADLKQLSESGQELGLHSYDHPTVLCNLQLEEQKLQYQKNRDFLQAVSGREITAMSHPCNSYNQETLKILRDLGIICGFRSNMAPPSGGINASFLEIAREDSTNILEKMKVSGLAEGKV
jgi:peptidoglycan/xylan/chitin deacetylase (PgdA/CDA1 family)